MKIVSATLAVCYFSLAGNTICRIEDEIAKVLTVVDKLMDEGEKSTATEAKFKKFDEAQSVLTKTIDTIKKSGRIYTDEELAPLHTYRGLCNYALCEYEQALSDFALSAKCSVETIYP